MGEETKERPRPPHIRVKEERSEVKIQGDRESQDTGQTSRELWPGIYSHPIALLETRLTLPAYSLEAISSISDGSRSLS